MTFEEAKKSIRWILTVSHPIGSWELENIMDALDISTCKVAKALWGNKGNIPDIDISRVKNGTPLEAQRWIPKNGDMIVHDNEYGNYTINNVIGWQPLPSPYKGGKDEKTE